MSEYRILESPPTYITYNGNLYKLIDTNIVAVTDLTIDILENKTNKMLEQLKEQNNECIKCKYRKPCEKLNFLDVANDCKDLREFVDDIRAEAIDEFVGNFIEEIEEVKTWYEEKYKEINDVQICIVLEDLNKLIERLEE